MRWLQGRCIPTVCHRLSPRRWRRPRGLHSVRAESRCRPVGHDSTRTRCRRRNAPCRTTVITRGYQTVPRRVTVSYRLERYRGAWRFTTSVSGRDRERCRLRQTMESVIWLSVTPEVTRPVSASRWTWRREDVVMSIHPEINIFYFILGRSLLSWFYNYYNNHFTIVAFLSRRHLWHRFRNVAIIVDDSGASVVSVEFTFTHSSQDPSGHRGDTRDADAANAFQSRRSSLWTSSSVHSRTLFILAFFCPSLRLRPSVVPCMVVLA